MTSNENYQNLIREVEKALNELTDAIKDDRHEGRKGTYDLLEECKWMTYHKATLHKRLMNLGYIKY